MMARPEQLDLCLLLTTKQDSAHMILLENKVQCELRSKVCSTYMHTKIKGGGGCVAHQ